MTSIRLRQRAKILAAKLSVLTVAAVAVASANPLAADAATRYSGAGLSTNFDWATLLLRDGGWPTSSNNITVITQWMDSEEPPSNWWDRNNPLNNGLGSGGGSGLGRYSDLTTAAYYAAQNLQANAYGYPAIAADLASSAAPSTTAQAIWNSQWAGSHYGYGSSWHTGSVPVVAAPSSAWTANTSGPAPTGAVPVALARPGGGIEDLFENLNGEIGANWYRPANGQHGTPWNPIALPPGMTAVGNPSAVLRPGYPVYDVSVRSSTGVVEQTWYNYSSGTWGGWVPVGSTTVKSDPALTARPNSSFDDVFAVAGNVVGTAQYNYGTGAAGTWHSSNPLYGGTHAVGNVSVHLRPGTTIYDVLVRDSNSILEGSWYNYDTNQWGGWIRVIGATSNTVSDNAVSLLRPSSTVYDNFAENNGVVETNWFNYNNAPYSGNWSPAVPMRNGAHAVGNPSAVQRTGTTVYDIFVRDSNNLIEETWYDYSNGRWGGWIIIGSSGPLTRTGDPTVITLPSEGQEDIFATNNGALGANWFNPGSAGTGGWASIS